MAIVECGGRVLEQVAPDYYTGWRRFLCGKSEVQMHMEWLWDQVYIGMSGSSAPRVVRTKATNVPGDVPGVAFIEAWYASKWQPGKAKITIRRHGKTRKIERDLDNKLMEGPLGSGNEFKLNEYENAVPIPGGIVTLETGYEASGFNLGTFANLVGDINANTFYTFPAKTLMYLAPECEQTYGDDIVNVNHIFQWEPRGWDNAVTVQEGAWVAYRKPVRDALGTTVSSADVLDYWPGMRWVETGSNWALQAVAPETRRIASENAFGPLSGLLIW